MINKKSKIENRKLHKPRLIAFEVTRRCRFNCLHCRANAGQSDEVAELTTEKCERILLSIADFNKPIIILTGGEPMERTDIFDLIEFGRNLGLQMVMATCGYLINDKSISRLKDAGISALSFSLDGYSAKTHDAFRQTAGAFDSVIKAADLAHRTGIRFQINTTITKTNVDEVAEIAQIAEKLGAYCFNPFILVPTGRAKEIPDQILAPDEYENLLNDLIQLKQNSKIQVRVTCGPQFARLCRQKGAKELTEDVSGCMAGRGFGFISYRGDVQTCGFLNISAGNLIENNFNFAEIWLQSDFLNKIRNRKAYKGNCGICQYLKICGGCRARAYSITGDYLATDPVCSYIPKEKN